jgi:hypothetical protein
MWDFPVVLTSRGRGIDVAQALQNYGANIEQQAFMKAVVTGMFELEEGSEFT